MVPQEYRELLERLDRLDARGRHDSEEADVLRLRLDALWPRLSGLEQKQMHKFSAYLRVNRTKQTL